MSQILQSGLKMGLNKIKLAYKVCHSRTVSKVKGRKKNAEEVKAKRHLNSVPSNISPDTIIIVGVIKKRKNK